MIQSGLKLQRSWIKRDKGRSEEKVIGNVCAGGVDGHNQLSWWRQQSVGWMQRGEINERKWLVLIGGPCSLPELLRPPPASPAAMHNLLRPERKTHLRRTAAEMELLSFRSTLSIFTRWPQIKYTDIGNRHTRRGKKRNEEAAREGERLWMCGSITP